MNVEETAERFSHERPGFDLASYGEVGLPFFRLRLRLQVLEHKAIGPIEEFILRGVSTGLADVSTLEAALGLDRAVLEVTVVDLVEADALEILDPDAGVDRLRLTPRGTDLLSEARQILSRETVVEIDFDGLLRVPVSILPMYLEPRELAESGIREVPAHPAKRPDRSEVRGHAGEIERIARQAGGPRQQLSDVISVRAVERRQRIFQPALALVYRPKGSRRSQGQVAFVINGQLSTPHAEVFARAGLGKKLGLAKRGIEDAKVAAGRILGEELVGQIDESQGQVPLKAAAAKVPTETVRPVETYEHPGLLREALRSSSQRLLVISPWLRAGVIDKEFLTLLRAALNRGVQTYIGWGMSASETDSPDADPAVLRELEGIARDHKNFHFKRLGRTHAKVLICDDRFVVVTSFNWLSFQGNPKRTFRDERGTLVSIQKHVDKQFETLSQPF